MSRWLAHDQARENAVGQVAFVTCFPLENYYGWQQRVAGSMDGKFMEYGLAPGEYLAVASRELLQNFEFRNEAVLRRYLTKGTVVTVPAGKQTIEIQVPLLKDGDTGDEEN